MNPTPRFKGQILRQVYRVWLMRKFLPVLIVEVALFSAALYLVARYVFIERVIENASNVFFQHPTGIVSFFISAYIHTPIATKLFVVAAIVLIVLVLRKLTQGLLRYILVRENYFSREEGGSKGL